MGLTSFKLGLFLVEVNISFYIGLLHLCVFPEQDEKFHFICSKEMRYPLDVQGNIVDKEIKTNEN